MWRMTAHNQSIEKAAWFSGILLFIFGLVGFSANPADSLIIGGVVLVEVRCEREVSLRFLAGPEKDVAVYVGQKSTDDLALCRG